MSNRRFGLYMMRVLSYYRSEWTDVSDEDRLFSIVLTRDLKKLIKDCMDQGINVPNAARDVRYFLEAEARRAFEAKNGAEPPFAQHGREMSGGLAELYEDWKSNKEGEENDCGGS